MAMPEQVLDDADIDALLQQVGGKAVAQRVHGDGLVETGSIGGLADRRAARNAP